VQEFEHFSSSGFPQIFPARRFPQPLEPDPSERPRGMVELMMQRMAAFWKSLNIVLPPVRPTPTHELGREGAWSGNVDLVCHGPFIISWEERSMLHRPRKMERW
jgi:hypothetical protein